MYDSTIHIVARDEEREHVVVIFELDGDPYEESVIPAQFAQPGDDDPVNIQERITRRAAYNLVKLQKSPEMVAKALRQILATNLDDDTPVRIELKELTQSVLVWEYSWHDFTDTIKVSLGHWTSFLSFLCEDGLTPDTVTWIQTDTKKDIERKQKQDNLPAQVLADFIENLPVEPDPHQDILKNLSVMLPTLRLAATSP